MKRKFMRYILMGAVAFAWLLTPGLNKTYAATDRSSVHAFYTNPLNTTPDSSTMDNGLEYFARLSAKNTLTGNTEFSSKSWNTGSAYDIYSLVANSADVFDRTNSSELALLGQLKNTTDADISVSMSFELPGGSLVKVDDSRINGNPVTNNYGPNFLVRYHYNGSNYTYDQLMALPDFSWSGVSNVSFSGKLGPGEIADVNLPLVLQSQDPSTVNIRVRSYAPARKSTWLRVRASRYMYTLDDMMSGVYVGAYRETRGGVDTYKQIPSNLQALMPQVQKEDFIYSMFKTLYRAGMQADMTQASDGVAYDHSVYLINTERIFHAVKDEGFSTYRDDVRGLWNSYAYYMGGNLDFTDDQENPVEMGVYDNKAGVQLSKYYVELHKVFDTKDIELTVGDPWNQFDNLTYRQSISDRSSGSHTLTDDEIEVTNNVDNQTPGEYWVKYSHKVDDGKYVTKTAKVIVRGKEAPTTPKNPDTPKNSDPSTPKNPNTPDRPKASQGKASIATSPKTGDPSDLLLYGSALLLSASGLLVLTSKKKPQ